MTCIRRRKVVVRMTGVHNVPRLPTLSAVFVRYLIVLEQLIWGARHKNNNSNVDNNVTHSPIIAVDFNLRINNTALFPSPANACSSCN